MRYAGIDKCEICNGQGFGVSLYVQGCDFHCKGCFNPETWDFNGGSKFFLDEENKIIQLLKQPHIERLTIIGGEPMHPKNAFSVYCLIVKVRNIFGNDKKIWLYTGYKFEDLYIDQYANDMKDYYKATPQNNILHKLDVLVDGQFIEEQKDLTLPFRGSSNQRIIDVQASLRQNKIVIKKVR